MKMRKRRRGTIYSGFTRFNDEDLGFLSKKFKKILIERRKDVISMRKKESGLDKGKNNAMCATWDQRDASETENDSDEE